MWSAYRFRGCGLAFLALLSLASTQETLVEFITDEAPWEHWEANSDQMQPLYFGQTPRELAQSGPVVPTVLPLATELKGYADVQLQSVISNLAGLPPGFNGGITVECWPAYEDSTGYVTWTWARWRYNGSQPWSFVKVLSIVGGPPVDTTDEIPEPWLPQVYKPWRELDNKMIFADFLDLGDLYAKPVFGNCLWTTEDSKGSTAATAFGGWLDLSMREDFNTSLTIENSQRKSPDRLLCRTLPQPPRINGSPFSIVLPLNVSCAYNPTFKNQSCTVTANWPRYVDWTTRDASLPPSQGPVAPVVQSWPADFDQSFVDQIRQLDGEALAYIGSTPYNFTRKNSADPMNQFADLIAYLQAYYSNLGLNMTVLSFSWRGIEQPILIAKILGSDSSLGPVIIADHYDTAFCEDVFEETGERQSAPGADDNLSATSTLMLAGKVLRNVRPKRDIWLVHLPGEEFPGDDLGARYAISYALKGKVSIGAIIQLDMIAWRRNSSDGIFQINAGDSLESRQLARLAIDVSQYVVKTGPAGMEAQFRSRFDPRSYLFQTDGIVYSDAGFPTILINEHINRLENFDRPHYHQTTDQTWTLDIPYGATVARVAIETLAQAAGAQQTVEF